MADDDPPLLRTMGAFLARRGHEIVTCENTGQAWEKFQAEPEVYSVLIVDLTIHGMPAVELIERVLDARPQVAVVVTSGYPVKLPLSAKTAGARVVALQKPFQPVTLEQAIEELLSPEGGTDSPGAG